MYAAVYVGTADKSVPRKRIEDFVYLTQILRISGVGLLRGIRRGQHSGGAAAAVVDQRVVRAKYLIYKSIVVGAVIDFVFPLGAFVISSLAMFLIMFLTSLYGLWKIKNGDIIADVRNDFV